jgi:putative NADH-flavin reductase
MRLLVVGANGALGRQIVERAARTGHQVTALVRRADSMAEYPDVRVLEGSVGEQLDVVASAIDGHDAVLSGLGNHTWLRGGQTITVMAAATANLVTAMEAQNVTRMVVPLAWGAGASRSATSTPIRLITRGLMRDDFTDLDAAEQNVDTADLDWTVAYFGALTDGAASGQWTVNETLKRPRPLRISRADVADFLVSTVEHDRYRCQRVVLSGPK